MPDPDEPSIVLIVAAAEAVAIIGFIAMLAVWCVLASGQVMG